MAASINSIPTVEFILMPKEDLYLIGPKRTKSIKRVEKGEKLLLLSKKIFLNK